MIGATCNLAWIIEQTFFSSSSTSAEARSTPFSPRLAGMHKTDNRGRMFGQAESLLTLHKALSPRASQSENFPNELVRAPQDFFYRNFQFSVARAHRKTATEGFRPRCVIREAIYSTPAPLLREWDLFSLLSSLVLRERRKTIFRLATSCVFVESYSEEGKKLRFVGGPEWFSTNWEQSKTCRVNVLAKRKKSA